jgi:hypothetical protein
MKSSHTLFATVFSVACLSLLTASASAQLWTFDSDAQGWRINDLTGGGNYTTSQGTFAATWNAVGGNPGGFISGRDPSNFSFMFQAPSSQLGDYSRFLGGKLDFSLQTDLVADYSVDSVIILRGGGSNQTLVSAIAPQPNPTWTSYSIPLLASQFHYDNLGGAIASASDFAAVLSGLNDFLINAEYHNGAEETTGLDSVAFLAPVPEPSTYGTVVSVALLAVAASRRGRRARQTDAANNGAPNG